MDKQPANKIQLVILCDFSFPLLLLSLFFVLFCSILFFIKILPGFLRIFLRGCLHPFYPWHLFSPPLCSSEPPPSSSPSSPSSSSHIRVRNMHNSSSDSTRLGKFVWNSSDTFTIPQDSFVCLFDFLVFPPPLPPPPPSSPSPSSLRGDSSIRRPSLQ